MSHTLYHSPLWDRLSSLHNLTIAWTKVKANQGAAGVDRVTIREFEQALEGNLGELAEQLTSGDFSPLPVLRAYVDKEDGGQRPLGIPAVRDRIVQQAALFVLSPIFDQDFLSCSFAYRPGRSAVDAVRQVETLLREGHKWVFDADIERFFNNIDHEILLGFVKEKISETRVIDLIQKFLKAGVFENMSVREEYLGIAQGSALSPLLANIYLHRFDQQMTNRGYHLIRYADDFVVLDESQQRIGMAMADAVAVLGNLRLLLSEKKTRLIPARSGFIFLGYHFDTKGKGPSKRSIDVLQQKLKQASEASAGKDFAKRVEVLKQIMRGWASYFASCRGIQAEDADVLTAMAELAFELGDYESAKDLSHKRKDFAVHDPEYHYRFGRLMRMLGMKEESMKEFSRTLSLSPDHNQAKDELHNMPLVDDDVFASIKRLQRLIHQCPDLSQPYRDLAFCYGEIGEYGLAQEVYSKSLEVDSSSDKDETIAVVTESETRHPAEDVSFTQSDIDCFLSLFKGRAGVYGVQWIDERGRRGFRATLAPLTDEAIRAHLVGEQTLGLYVMDERNRVQVSVIDVDVDQRSLIELARNTSRLDKVQQLTQRHAASIASLCHDLDIPVLIEDSGYKGRHVWFFFATPVDGKVARRFLKFICEQVGSPSAGIHREIFPNCDRLKAGGYGPMVKLPLGVHKRTNARCLFLDAQGRPLKDQMETLRQIRLIDQASIENLLIAYSSRGGRETTETEAGERVRSLISGCRIVKRLTEKARDIHYLDHGERITLLYTLGHLGDEGKGYLHKVMGNCINYDFQQTERYIRKLQPFPISCARIREKHEELALDLGCDCVFKLPPRGYPSPVLHALKGKHAWRFQKKLHSTVSPESAPVARSRAGDLESCVKGYVELKRQMVGLERSLRRIEDDMAAMLQARGTDTIQTEFGLLEMRKSGDGIEWTVRV